MYFALAAAAWLAVVVSACPGVATARTAVPPIATAATARLAMRASFPRMRFPPGCAGPPAGIIFSPGDGPALVIEELQAGPAVLGVDGGDQAGDALPDRELGAGAAELGLDPARGHQQQGP